MLEPAFMFIQAMSYFNLIQSRLDASNLKGTKLDETRKYVIYKVIQTRLFWPAFYWYISLI